MVNRNGGGLGIGWANIYCIYHIYCIYCIYCINIYCIYCIYNIQTTENLPFPSILSSLDYLLSGLTLWIDTLELDSAWFTCHSHSISFFIHQHFIHHVAIFFIHDVVSVPEKADRSSFLSALWCTLNLPHSLTLLISPHFIICFVNHT